MKLAVAGKGGVGKTTLVALLAREAVARGYRVIAVDADPDSNLAMTLGIDQPIVTLAEERELIKERVGAEGFVKLNPTVDDIPDRYSVEQDGIRLLVLGGVRRGGGGCACPANTLLQSLLRHLFLQAGEVVIVDIRGEQVQLGINAPRDVPVHRREVYEAIVKENGRVMPKTPRSERMNSHNRSEDNGG